MLNHRIRCMYLGHDFQWGIFEIIPSLELSASLNNRLLSVRQKLIIKTRTGDPRHVTIGQLILWDFPVHLRHIWNHFKVVLRFSVLTYLENETMKLKTTNWLKNGKQQNEQLRLEGGKLCIFYFLQFIALFYNSRLIIVTTFTVFPIPLHSKFPFFCWNNTSNGKAYSYFWLSLWTWAF